jgi:hypothetical protein
MAQQLAIFFLAGIIAIAQMQTKKKMIDRCTTDEG